MPRQSLCARFRRTYVSNIIPNPDALPASIESPATWTTAELNDKRQERKVSIVQRVQCKAPTNEDVAIAETITLLILQCLIRRKAGRAITSDQFYEGCRALLKSSDESEPVVKNYMRLIIFMSANVLVVENLLDRGEVDRILQSLIGEHPIWKREKIALNTAARYRLNSGHYARAMSTLASVIGDSAFAIPIRNSDMLNKFKQWAHLTTENTCRLDQSAFAALRPAERVHTFLGGESSPIEMAKIESILQPQKYLFFPFYDAEKKNESRLWMQHKEAVDETVLSMESFGSDGSANGTTYRACHEFARNAKKASEHRVASWARALCLSNSGTEEPSYATIVRLSDTVTWLTESNDVALIFPYFRRPKIVIVKSAHRETQVTWQPNHALLLFDTSLQSKSGHIWLHTLVWDHEVR